MLTRSTTSTTTAKSSSQRNHPYGRKGGQKSTRVTSRVTSSSSRKRNKLHVNYTTPSLPGSFTAVRNLKRYAKGETFNAVKRYLAAQDAYTLHKQRRIRFPRRKTYSKGIADLYQADLVDMINISRYSDSHRFLSTTIDCFRKNELGHSSTDQICRSRDGRFRKSAGISSKVRNVADRCGKSS